MTTTKNVDLEKGTTEIAEYSATEAALAQLREKYGTVPDANTEAGYALIKSGLKELVGLRNRLEDARKREKAPLLLAGKIIDDEAKRITAELVKLEDPMAVAKKAADERIEREQKERIARLQVKVDAIKGMPAQVRGKSSDEIAEMIDRCGEIDTAHDFYDLTKEAQEAQAMALGELAQMLTDRLAFEQAERQRLELEAQQAELNRQLEEQRAQLQRQQDEINRQREELARQSAELQQAPLEPAVSSEMVTESAPQQQRQREPVATIVPAIDDGQRIKMGNITARLGFAVTADFLRSLGFEPAGREQNAILYRASDFPLICNALIAHIEKARDGQQAAA